MQILRILVFIGLSWMHCESKLTCKQARTKVAKKGKCEMTAGEEPQECYNLCDLTPITLKDCKKKVNTHCCIYEGKCIIKGGVKNLIPTAFTTTPKSTTTPAPPATTAATTAETTSSLTCKDVKLRISKKALCKPKSMYETKVQGCYDLCTMKLIKSPKACLLKKNSHCCMYKGRCILKGAGTKAGEIPIQHQLTPETTASAPTITTTMETTTKAETCLKARFRIKKAECEPEKEDEMQDCYDLCTKKPVDPKDCNLPKNSHCCLHDCRCIIKGAGSKEGKIPLDLQLELPKKKITYKPKLMPGCKPKSKPKPKPAKTTTKPKTKKIKPSKKPKGPKTTKKTKTKKTKKPKTKPTPATKKTKCPKKSTTAKPFSFSFFSRFSSLLSGFGIQSEVVANEDC